MVGLVASRAAVTPSGWTSIMSKATPRAERRGPKICAVSGCHRNLHTGYLQIKVAANGKLVFLDGEGRRLDRRVNLEVAGWLDWWHGWKGTEVDSHYARVHQGLWEVAV